MYGPHMWMIRLLGYRWGLRWARKLAGIHYLATFAGVHRQLLGRFEQLKPHFRTDKNARQILRRYLEVKHLSFAEWRLSATQHGQRALAAAREPVTGQEHLRTALAHGRGVILAVYHHGMYKLSQRWIVDLVNQDPALQGATVYQVAFVSAQYGDQTLGPVARLAMRDAVSMIQDTELEYICIQPKPRPMPIIKALRGGNFVGVAADGVLSSDFMEVPFLDGTVQLPCGWARLAALNSAPIVLVVHTADDRDRHHLTFHEPILVEANKTEVVEAAVGKCAQQLEEHIRDEPWDWHIWHRIRLMNSADEPPRLQIISNSHEREFYDAGK